MNPIIDLTSIKEKTQRRTIDIQSCSAIIEDSISKLENYNDQPEVQQIISYLQSSLEQFDD